MASRGHTRTGTGEAIERLARRLCGRGSSQGVARGLRHDREFESLLTLLMPRFAKQIRQYGLSDLREDAEQVAAIGVHRALESFDPEKASFSTHAMWQIKGELQGLRHRMRLDQRRSARTAGITTVSMEALRSAGEPDTYEIVDESSLSRAERGASDALTSGLVEGLLDRLDAPQDERRIVHDHLFDREPTSSEQHRRTSEQRRQIIRRTMRNCAKVMAA